MMLLLLLLLLSILIVIIIIIIIIVFQSECVCVMNFVECVLRVCVYDDVDLTGNIYGMYVCVCICVCVCVCIQSLCGAHYKC